MARYTMELREIISTFGEEEVKNWFMDYDLTDYITEEQIETINNAGVWNKEKLAKRILDHFYLREIGTDSPGSFRLFVKTRLNEVMERYAPLIYTISIKYDPLNNIDVTEEFNRSSSTEGTSSSTSNANGSSLSVQSDTPQGQINKSAILSGSYASNTAANENENSTTDSAQNSGTGNEEYTRRTHGMTGVTPQKLIEDYRKNIISINNDIIYALEPLFMAIY